MQILFVEDDAMNRRVVRDMLTIVGAEMTEAHDARMGLDMLSARQFDIVLMDLRMPGMDGLTAIRAIRERSDDKAKVPVIVVTADTAVGLRETCLDHGADDVLPKPVAMNALFDSIGRMISERGDTVVI